MFSFLKKIVQTVEEAAKPQATQHSPEEEAILKVHDEMSQYFHYVHRLILMNGAFPAFESSEVALYPPKEHGANCCYNIEKDNLPFVISSSDNILAFIKNVHLVSETNVRHYHGNSAGVSLRVAKGMSVRVGENNGKSHSEREEDHLGLGDVVITENYIYYRAERVSKRLPRSSVVTAEQGNVGVRITFNQGYPLYIQFCSYPACLALLAAIRFERNCHNEWDRKFDVQMLGWYAYHHQDEYSIGRILNDKYVDYSVDNLIQLYNDCEWEAAEEEYKALQNKKQNNS